jgi:hypothetical protein
MESEILKAIIITTMIAVAAIHAWWFIIISWNALAKLSERLAVIDGAFSSTQQR